VAKKKQQHSSSCGGHEYPVDPNPPPFTGKFIPPAPPVFPQDGKNVDRGISLRDWFAGKALLGMMGIVLREQEFGKEFPEVNDRAAALCYRLADAMIEARKGTP
jgi:hypothetical protein